MLESWILIGCQYFVSAEQKTVDFTVEVNPIRYRYSVLLLPVYISI